MGIVASDAYEAGRRGALDVTSGRIEGSHSREWHMTTRRRSARDGIEAREWKETMRSGRWRECRGWVAG